MAGMLTQRDFASMAKDGHPFPGVIVQKEFVIGKGAIALKGGVSKGTW